MTMEHFMARTSQLPAQPSALFALEHLQVFEGKQSGSGKQRDQCALIQATAVIIGQEQQRNAQPTEGGEIKV